MSFEHSDQVDNPKEYFRRPGVVSLGAMAALVVAIFISVSLGSPLLILAGAGTWTQTDMNNVQVTAVAVDPTNPNLIYAGTSGQGVFRSTDGGSTWTQSNTGLANLFVNEIQISIADPTVVIAATGRGPLVGDANAGIYRSTDRGATWTSRLSSFVGAVDVKPQNAQLLYAAGAPPVFRSTNNGADWVQAFADSTVFQNVDMLAVSISPANTSSVLVGGTTEGGTGGVFRTTDGGQTWVRVQDTTIQAVRTLSFSSTNGQLALLGNGQGIWRSRDAGVTWNLVFAGPAVLSILADPADGNTFYVGTFGQGVFQTTNGGDSFQSMNAGLGNQVVRSIAKDRSSPSTLWAGTDNGVWAFTLQTGTQATPTPTSTTPTPTPSPTLTPTPTSQVPPLAISPTSGPPGTIVSYTGTGYTPGGRVSVLLLRTLGIVVSTPTADQNGNISGSFNVPNALGGIQLPFGPIEIFAIDASTFRQAASTTFTLLQPSAAATWYFAEGSTQPPFDTWYLVQNPTDNPSTVRFTFFLGDGTTAVSQFDVDPHSRFSLFANEILPDQAISTRIEADQPVFAERSMFVGFDGNDVAGIAAPSTTWLFAEGSSQPPFHTWLLLQNPDSNPALATITYLVQGGTSQVQLLALPPTSRTSIFVNQVLPDSAFSTQVSSDRPIIVERSMFRFPGNAATDVAGVNQPAQTWFFAEGDTNLAGLPTDTWLLLQNPGAASVPVTITLFPETGSPTAMPQVLGPSSRQSILLNQLFQGSFGMRVDAPSGIIAERSMFIGTEPRGAAATVGSPVLATTWRLAEGSTAPPFDERINIMNPNPQAAAVNIEFDLESGPPVTRSFIAPAQGKLSIVVDDIIPFNAVSALVTTSIPTVVERTMFINKLDSVGLSTKIGIR